MARTNRTSPFKLKSQDAVSSGGFKLMGSSPLRQANQDMIDFKTNQDTQKVKSEYIHSQSYQGNEKYQKENIKVSSEHDVKKHEGNYTDETKQSVNVLKKGLEVNALRVIAKNKKLSTTVILNTSKIAGKQILKRASYAIPVLGEVVMAYDAGKFIYDWISTGSFKKAGENWLFSDIRLKENITRTGISKSGIPIYTFNYKNDNQSWSGAMAQDLLELGMEDAVAIMDNSYYAVNYGIIDVDMVKN